MHYVKGKNYEDLHYGVFFILFSPPPSYVQKHSLPPSQTLSINVLHLGCKMKFHIHKKKKKKKKDHKLQKGKKTKNLKLTINY